MNELTREQILAMPVGRELDALVARHVMGLDGWHLSGDFLKPYSLDIAAAWEVETEIDNIGSLRGEYVIALKSVLVSTEEYIGFFDYIHATPEQRCKSALLAKMGL